jgi:vacuolar-type H+-ATPase catalytic subunit A/Vma1
MPMLDQWLINMIGTLDIAQALAGGSATEKSSLYRRPGLHLVYEPTTRATRAQISNNYAPAGQDRSHPVTTILHLDLLDIFLVPDSDQAGPREFPSASCSQLHSQIPGTRKPLRDSQTNPLP